MTGPPEAYGSYVIEKSLGEGGMGVVYVARDARLGRRVALKTLHRFDDRTARQRLLREARVAASISHPNVCHIYEVGETEGRLFIAMELLDGEPLDARLDREGALPVDQALGITLDLLAALEAIHALDHVHRDVKPSNVFLTAHGAKLLDFGLTRPHDDAAGITSSLAITSPGTTPGTPLYMAPEQWMSEPLGPPCDLWAAGALLYEMVSGKAAFEARTLPEVIAAITTREPPALVGGADVVAVDRIVQRALEKKPGARYESATAMATAVRDARALEVTRERVPARATTRLVVLPFTALREDEESAFLRVSLPDAISAALSEVETLVVRSRMAFDTGAAQDIRTIAKEAGVDAVLAGTLARAKDQIRISAQLVEAPSGTIRWSQTITGSGDDLFALQDRLVHEVLGSLTIELSAGDRQRLGREGPRNPHAYETYLRANEVALSLVDTASLRRARTLYESCLREAPDFAPAWARLARVERIIAKYGHGDAETGYRATRDAFARALQLDPDLPLAHNYYTYLQMEEGRSHDAMVRLLERARKRPADPDLFAGLVGALRFCGLYEPSVAAHRRARRLDPAIPTGVSYTYFGMGDFQSSVDSDELVPRWCRYTGLSILGRGEEALVEIDQELGRAADGTEAEALKMLHAAIAGDRSALRPAIEEIASLSIRDPEARYMTLRMFVRLGDESRTVDWLRSIVGDGMTCDRLLRNDPWMSHLADREEIREILERSAARTARAAAAYVELGGERLLASVRSSA